MLMPYYTEEQILKARSIDLLTYLQTYEPTELVHVRGNTYCTREHDSLKISNGKWMWWSRGFGGSSALDYLIKVKGMQFMDAMKILTADNELALNNAPVLRESRQNKGTRKLLLPEKSETNLEVIRYLSSRGIDRDIIKECIEEGLLYDDIGAELLQKEKKKKKKEMFKALSIYFKVTFLHQDAAALLEDDDEED